MALDVAAYCHGVDPLQGVPNNAEQNVAEESSESPNDVVSHCHGQTPAEDRASARDVATYISAETILDAYPCDVPRNDS